MRVKLVEVRVVPARADTGRLDRAVIGPKLRHE